jgi:hypothetical protein
VDKSAQSGFIKKKLEVKIQEVQKKKRINQGEGLLVQDIFDKIVEI